MESNRMSNVDLENLSKILTKGNKMPTTKQFSIFSWIRMIATLSIPLVITIYTVVQKNNEEAIAKGNRLKDMDIAIGNRAKDEKIADDQRKENVLVEYQNFVAKLLLDYGMTLNGSASARFVVRVKTLTAVKQLDPARKTFLIQSLFEANLITTIFASEPMVSLESADLTRLNFGNSENNIERPTHPCLSLDGTILNNASFRRQEFDGASFDHAYIRFGDFTDSITIPKYKCYNQSPSKSVNFKLAILNDTIFLRALLVDAVFSFAEMFRTNLEGFDCHRCEMTGTKLIESNLIRATFLGPADLRGLKLTDSQLINARFLRDINLLQVNMERVNATRITIEKCFALSAVLVNGSFNHALIKDSLFNQANVTSANMAQITIDNTTFNSAHLINVNFNYAKCHRCMFIGAIFNGSSLHGASFTDSNFTDAIISDEQLEQAASLAGSILPNRTVVTN